MNWAVIAIFFAALIPFGVVMFVIGRNTRRPR